METFQKWKPAKNEKLAKNENFLEMETFQKWKPAKMETYRHTQNFKLLLVHVGFTKWTQG